MKHKRLFLAVLIVAMAAGLFLIRPSRPQTSFRADPAIQSALDSITADFRKIIVLVDGSDTLDEDLRSRAIAAGRIIFWRKHRALEELGQTLAGQYRQSARVGFRTGAEGVRQLLQYV